MASLDATTWVIFLLIAIIVVYIVRNERRMRALLRAGSTENLPETLAKFTQEIAALEKKDAAHEARIDNINGRVLRSIQKIETVRFNAFPDAGGSQSFATALLDEDGTGVVLSSLYLRDRVSVFAKPVTRYESTFTLTPEEAESVTKAKARS